MSLFQHFVRNNFSKKGVLRHIKIKNFQIEIITTIFMFIEYNEIFEVRVLKIKLYYNRKCDLKKITTFIFWRTMMQHNADNSRLKKNNEIMMVAICAFVDTILLSKLQTSRVQIQNCWKTKRFKMNMVKEDMKISSNNYYTSTWLFALTFIMCLFTF